jgi:hypothetical protein
MPEARYVSQMVLIPLIEVPKADNTLAIHLTTLRCQKADAMNACCEFRHLAGMINRDHCEMYSLIIFTNVLKSSRFFL